MKYYTFSTMGLNGKKYYPKEIKDSQGDLISNWTENKQEAVVWEDPEHFDCLMNEYCNTEVEEVIKNFITIINANNQNKFICFKIDGLKDGIMVGLYPNGDGLSIAYRGDVIGVPFNADSVLIDELNNGEFNV